MQKPVDEALFASTVEEKEDEDFYKGAAKKVEIEDDFDDPLDKPAFMRKMFGGKKK